MTKDRSAQRIIRKRRIRARVNGTAERPRLAVYRSNTRLIAQLIDDVTNTTLAAVSTSDSSAKTNAERIQESAEKLVAQAKEKNISSVVFDRGGFPYMGNIRAFAEAARKAGFTF